MKGPIPSHREAIEHWESSHGPMPRYELCGTHHTDWHLAVYRGGDYGVGDCEALAETYRITCEWNEPGGCTAQATTRVVDLRYF